MNAFGGWRKMSLNYFRQAFLAALIIAPSTAWAAFSAPINISPANRNGSDPQVAFDGDGDALMVWMDTVLSAPTSSVIRARTRTAGGAFGAVQNISAINGDAAFPEVAVNADGDGVIVWMGHDGSKLRVYARARSAAGGLGPIQIISQAGQDVFFPQIAVAPNGAALAVWIAEINDDNSQVKARARSAAGAWGPIINISHQGSVLQHEIAMDQDGDVLIIWNREGIQARSRSAAGALSPIQNVAQFGIFGKVAVDADGDALIVWDNLFPARIEGRGRTAAGVLGPVQGISPTGANVDTPDVGMDADGEAFIAWAQYPAGGNAIIKGRRRNAAGTLANVFHNLSATNDLHEDPRVAMADNGDLVVAWEREGSNTQDIQIQARGRSAAGAFTPIATLNADNQEARGHQAGIDPDGDAIVIWSQSTTEGMRVQASVGP
jgi:hypothetical protein